MLFRSGMVAVSRCSVAWGDYDRDGDMDAYLVTDRYSHMQHRGARFQRYPDGRIEVKPEFRQLYRIIEYPDGSMTTSPDGQNDHLFRNNGDGTFSDVSAAAGLTGDAPGLAATWWDYNDDGWPDIFVSNDFKEPDRLYHNNGDGTFTDVFTIYGLSQGSSARGAVWADYDLDGDLDLYVGNNSHAGRLYRNNTNSADYLKVKVTGGGSGFSPVDGTGAQVELWNTAGTVRYAMREVTGSVGYGSHDPRIVHFGLASTWGGGGGTDRKSTRLNSSHTDISRMPSSA